MKCNIVGCGKIDGGFEDGICLPCYAFITADQGEEHMKHPSYCCQKCGEFIGWLGRVMPFHKCKEKNT